jgi:hypothetical protein
MARTDSFFIRAQVLTNGPATYNEAAIDLGAYVDALGKSVLRIHNVQVQYGTAGENVGNLTPAVNTDVTFQLTTQSQTALVNLNNRSVVASGSLAIAADAAGDLTILSESLDVGPQHWTDGYLIAVEQMYLGVNQGIDALSAVSLVMECTVETMTQAAAMALALSQQ